MSAGMTSRRVSKLERTDNGMQLAPFPGRTFYFYNLSGIIVRGLPPPVSILTIFLHRQMLRAHLFEKDQESMARAAQAETHIPA
jgi:hypothetical protein